LNRVGDINSMVKKKKRNSKIIKKIREGFEFNNKQVLNARFYIKNWERIFQSENSNSSDTA